MNQESRLKLQMELLWWVFTAVVVTLVLFPVYLNVQQYPFWAFNIVFIIIFITYTRFFFLLKHTFFAKNLWVKLVIVFSALPMMLLITQGLGDFQKFLDERGVQSILGHLSIDKQNSFGSYIRSQMIFFGAASQVVTIIITLRLIISIWRVYNNTGKV